MPPSGTQRDTNRWDDLPHRKSVSPPSPCTCVTSPSSWYVSLRHGVCGLRGDVRTHERSLDEQRMTDLGGGLLPLDGPPRGRNRLAGLLPGRALGGPLFAYVHPHHAIPLSLRKFMPPCSRTCNRSAGLTLSTWMLHSTSRGRWLKPLVPLPALDTSRRPANGAWEPCA